MHTILIGAADRDMRSLPPAVFIRSDAAAAVAEMCTSAGPIVRLWIALFLCVGPILNDDAPASRDRLNFFPLFLFPSGHLHPSIDAAGSRTSFTTRLCDPVCLMHKASHWFVCDRRGGPHGPDV